MIQATRAEELGELTVNELEPAVFRVCPAVERLCQRVRAAGWEGVRVSGAGSTLFVLFDDRQEAAKAADKLRGLGLRCAPVGAGGNATMNPDGEQRDDER
jgi:4-diphosphocytidyl-2C-methyl-D-erythritol kinase